MPNRHGSEKFAKIFMKSETAKELDFSYNYIQCFGEGNKTKSCAVIFDDSGRSYRNVEKKQG